MAKSPSVRLIPHTKDIPTWFSPILLILNQFINQVASAFDKNLTIMENLNIGYKKLTLTMPSTCDSRPGTLTGVTNFPTFTFTNPIKSQPVSVTIGQIKPHANTFYNTDPAGVVGYGTSIEWHLDLQRNIVVYWVAGLAPSTSYDITFLVV